MYKNNYSKKKISVDDINNEEIYVGISKGVEINPSHVVSTEKNEMPSNYIINGPAVEVPVVRRKHSIKRGLLEGGLSKNHIRKRKIGENVDKMEDRLTCWMIYCNINIFIAFPFYFIMKRKPKEAQQAFKEKIALLVIISTLCVSVGFLTFGLQQVLCGNNTNRLAYSYGIGNNKMLINGQVYSTKSLNDLHVDGIENIISEADGKDLSFLFQNENPNCKEYFVSSNNQVLQTYFPCIATDFPLSNTSINSDQGSCNLKLGRKDLKPFKKLGDLYYTWNDIRKSPDRYIIYNGIIIDTKKLQYIFPNIELSSDLKQLINPKSGYLNTDISYFLENNYKQLGKCLEDTLKVGVLDIQTVGCISFEVVLNVSLLVILGVILSKFFMALLFYWSLGKKLGKLRSETKEEQNKRVQLIEEWSTNLDIPGCEYIKNNVARFSINNLSNQNNKYKNLTDYSAKKFKFLPKKSKFSTAIPGTHKNSSFKQKLNFNKSEETQASSLSSSHNNRTFSFNNEISILNRHVAPNPPPVDFRPFEFPLAHTLLLITCYSEDEAGIRSTLDSLALTDYPNSHKMLFVVCDGLVTGAGNSKSTPEICISMMKDFVIPSNEVQDFSYVSISDGSKRHNKAKVYAGYYKFDEKIDLILQMKVPMILVVKVGAEEESSTQKPGNRGKRDSQVILMSFLQRIMFNERLSELDYQLFNAMWNLSGVTPDSYEICLMVDADTKVYPDSLTKMVSVMVKDEKVMGLCGETKIANKSQSWVTMIQVFEYYISHHMTKSFESMFGGVTCLPGCFCMYRIKAPKGPNGYWTPILANPDIIDYYSENIVKTLHEKNLLSLGEDRYLTTLMLKTFPKRKMLFAPEAICKTLVPDNFEMLLSQRRRWINSTIHNLLELVLVNDLCGTFCFSMQFIIFIELIGTVVLPAAITFTIYLIVISTFTRPVPIIPLTLLAAILGLPAILILFTTRKIGYIGWMLIYLLSLPIWNFVFPIYSFWNFDDFSWGETRQVEGEKKGSGHKEGGVFDETMITMNTWEGFERENRKKAQDFLVLFFMSNGSQSELDKKLNEIGYLSPNMIQKIFFQTQDLLISDTYEQNNYNTFKV